MKGSLDNLGSIYQSNSLGLKRAEFNSYESGQIIAGIKHWIRTDLGLESHECYQYSSLSEVIEEVEAFQRIEGMEKIEVVTHRGQYEGMKTLYRWKKGWA